MKMLDINTITGHQRMSTETLLRMIEAAVKAGETDFRIQASGQHDIGGPLWNQEGRTLHFEITNAGQRAGAMCLPHTEIYLEDSAPADVGWLNSGGTIVVRGDAGDTTGHCAAGGLIYIGGRTGTRSGSLMKHDPLYEPPQLWILKNTGSFSFEFMGGGIAVVCGWDCEEGCSVLGERSCVGMLGGVVYFRGKAGSHTDEVQEKELHEEDIQFLQKGMPGFLKAVKRSDLQEALCDWTSWHKMVPLTYEEKLARRHPQNVRDFRLHEWVRGGIFSDVCQDDFQVHTLVETGLYRLRVPVWENHRFSAPCEAACPAGIPTQKRYGLIREGRKEEAQQMVLAYTPFPASVCGYLCPHPCMQACARGSLDEPIRIAMLGRDSLLTEPAPPHPPTGKKIAVIGGGAAGLSAAWQLVRRGHEVTVYEADAHMGGKMEQVIPRDRLPASVLQAELDRIERAGVHFICSYQVDAEKFQRIREHSDAVIAATGGYRKRVLTCDGAERAVDCLSYLAAVNQGRKPPTGRCVIVIGAGDSGMDAARTAYRMGADKVICLARSVPRASREEINDFLERGGEVLTHFQPASITEKGMQSEDGRTAEGDMVIQAIGEEPVLDYLSGAESVDLYQGTWLLPRRDSSVLPGVFAAGDAVHPGRLVDAVAAGARAAHFADAYVMGKEASPFVKAPAVSPDRIHSAFFQKFRRDEMPEGAAGDVLRCMSCGTCRSCDICIEACPRGAISKRQTRDGGFELVSDPEKCIGCGICEGVCPCGIWRLTENPVPIPMYRNGVPTAAKQKKCRENQGKMG